MQEGNEETTHTFILKSYTQFKYLVQVVALSEKLFAYKNYHGL